MNAHAYLQAALTRWRDDKPRDHDGTEAALRHIEALALASCAQELREIRLTLQAQHEEALDRSHAR